MTLPIMTNNIQHLPLLLLCHFSHVHRIGLHFPSIKLESKVKTINSLSTSKVTVFPLGYENVLCESKEEGEGNCNEDGCIIMLLNRTWCRNPFHTGFCMKTVFSIFFFFIILVPFNSHTKTVCDTRSIIFAEYNSFNSVFHVLNWLPNQG